MDYQTIKLSKREKGVTWVMIDHPPVNAINHTVMEELDHAVMQLSNDPDVRAIVIGSAHPKIFLAGADLKAMNAGADQYAGDEQAISRGSARMQQCFHRLSTIEKPVIAAINGHALGGGCELALACDFRIMGKGRIGLTEVALGIIPGAGGTQRLPRLIGRAQAIELIFTAKQLEAEEAERIGLITKAVDPDYFEEETTRFAERIAEGAVKAMGLAKRAINAAELPIEEGLQVEAQAFAETFLTDEPAIGLAAFFNKENAKFI